MGLRAHCLIRMPSLRGTHPAERLDGHRRFHRPHHRDAFGTLRLGRGKLRDSAHVGAQNGGNLDGSVRTLIVFQHRHQRASHGQA